ncbi:MAG: hypothetical protein JKY56_08195, partial [Kofleriaceae bacterium]|nr:hypothetical protein [Kofleriaceae bacterium]
MKFRLLAIGSGIIHVAIGGALIIAGMWQIEEISRPNRGVVMAATLPGMASSGGSPKAAEPKALVKPKKKIVREERQPTDRKPEKTDPSTETNSQTGDSNGSGGNGEGEGPGEGSGSGDNPGPGNGEGGLGIIICLENCNLPSAPKAVIEDAPKHLPPTVLSELTRVSGEAQVQPPS